MRARKEAGVFGLDDLLIFIGWFVSVGFTTTAVIDAKWYGIDVHTWDVRLDMVENLSCPFGVERRLTFL